MGVALDRRLLKSQSYAVLLLVRSFRAFNIAPFSEKTLHEAGEQINWAHLEKILHPITNCSFAVEDVISQHLVDTARTLFDASAGSSRRGATLWNLVLCRPKRKENIELLLSAGVNPDTPDDQNKYRLSHTCAAYGWREAAGAIFMCRPDMAARNSNNDTPLMAAVREDYVVRFDVCKI